jgi:hypothetical protein
MRGDGGAIRNLLSLNGCSIFLMSKEMDFDHMSSAVSNTGTAAVLLQEDERDVIVLRLLERLAVDVTCRAPWDGAAGPEGKRRPDGWKLIPMYVGGRPCVMFPQCARSMWNFRSGSDLRRVLDECPAIEFYVCDEEASYLLCSNHHDFLIGWGAASQWVERLEAAE